MLAITKIRDISILRMEHGRIRCYIPEAVFALPKQSNTECFLVCIHDGMREIKSCSHIRGRVDVLC